MRGGIYEFGASLLRGAGQVMFQNNVWTGLLFLAGIFWGAYEQGTGLVAWGALLGLVAATLTGRLLGLPGLRRRAGALGLQRHSGGLRLPDLPREHGGDVAGTRLLRRAHDVGADGLQQRDGPVAGQLADLPLRLLHVVLPARRPRHARHAARPHGDARAARGRDSARPAALRRPRRGMAQGAFAGLPHRLVGHGALLPAPDSSSPTARRRSGPLSVRPRRCSARGPSVPNGAPSPRDSTASAPC